ncbi:2-cys peroxiredoxin [Pelomyxa schiedti]|nr:2-cys peroxiredoxin [Pelomyxa schiedti]
MASLINKPAPSWSKQAVIDGAIRTLTSAEYNGKWLVLFFYPLDFTFVCPTEIIAFSESVAQFKAINCEVVACSIDSQFTHLAWINTARRDGGLGPMHIPIVADLDKKMSADYGVLVTEGPNAGVALRGLFIIDPRGNIRQITVNDLPVGRSVDETLRLVKAFQFVEEHGDVCPANWHPGARAIKPSPTGIKEFLSANSS